MKILVLWDYYNLYFSYFYKNHPTAQLLPYVDQLKEIQKDFFCWPTYLVPHFSEFGHEAELVIGNCKPLQQKWAQENDVFFQDKDWHLEIVLEQIRRYKPDILFLGGYGDIYVKSILSIARKYCRCIAAWKAAWVSSKLSWSNIDFVLSSHINIVESFRKMGLSSERVLPCFETKILDYLPSRTPDIDISFVGTLDTVIFARRMQFLKRLKRDFPIKIFAEKPSFRRRPWPLKTFLKQFSLLSFVLNPKLEETVYGLNMFRVLRNSKMTINIHVSSAQGLAGNIRMFEATGVGTLLITEAAPNIHELFVPEKEVITYKGLDELIEKIRYYLSHVEEGEAIAQMGQKRTLTDHNSRNRASEILTLFKKYLQKKNIKMRPYRRSDSHHEH